MDETTILDSLSDQAILSRDEFGRILLAAHGGSGSTVLYAAIAGMGDPSVIKDERLLGVFRSSDPEGVAGGTETWEFMGRPVTMDQEGGEETAHYLHEGGQAELHF